MPQDALQALQAAAQAQPQTVITNQAPPQQQQAAAANSPSPSPTPSPVQQPPPAAPAPEPQPVVAPLSPGIFGAAAHQPVDLTHGEGVLSPEQAAAADAAIGLGSSPASPSLLEAFGPAVKTKIRTADPYTHADEHANDQKEDAEIARLQEVQRAIDAAAEASGQMSTQTSSQIEQPHPPLGESQGAIVVG